MRTKNVLAALVIACVSVLSQPALAQSQSVQVTGSVSTIDNDGFRDRATFTCTGFPTCTGVGNVSVRYAQCSNGFSYSMGITFTGFQLSAPGAFQVTVHPSQDTTFTPKPDGTCVYAIVPPGPDSGGVWSATWDGRAGSFVVLDSNGGGTFSASFPANAPVFPMTVTASITTSTASATATIQPRAQDAGTTESIFVFAQVPASLLTGKRAPLGPTTPAAPLDGDICVLAQLNDAGQLTAVSSSSMQPALTGTLTAQGQAVTLLNNVATSSIAGATFFVGYGPSSSAMIANGVYQPAVTIPGASQCLANLSSAPAPTSPGALSGLWWNPNESGWGINFTQRRNILFAAWFTYDETGNPKWYVASSCAMPAGTTGTSGTCTGSIFEVAGPVFFGVPFDPTRVGVNSVGNLSVTFTDQNTASMTYTVKGQTRTVPIVRQVFSSGTASPAVDFSDLWYNPAESGWGMAVSQQFGVMFLAWFVYDANGKPMWFVASDCVVTGTSCSGTLFRTTGPAFGPTFDPTKVQVFQAGTIRVDFTDANNATLTYTVNGTASRKTITRQTF